MLTRTRWIGLALAGLVLWTAFALSTSSNADAPPGLRFIYAILFGGVLLGVLPVVVIWLGTLLYARVKPHRESEDTVTVPESVTPVALPAHTQRISTPAPVAAHQQARAANAAPSHPEPERHYQPARPVEEEQRPRVDMASAFEGVNALRRRQAEENVKRTPTLLAPVKPAPKPRTREDVDIHDPERVNRILAEIDALPGMEKIGAQVRTMTRRIVLDQQRKAAGLAVAEPGTHLLLIGPAGVGKTTIARIYGRVLAATGMLPSGHVVETSAADLVDRVVGGTAPKTLAKVDEAMGGVLFVDEAYSLVPETQGGGNDFGAEAVAALLKAMEDRRGEFCVIAAGYPREMERFLDSNSGLRSRFSKTVAFDHYDAAALYEIALSMATKADYCYTEDAQALLRQVLARAGAAKRPGWANARSVRGLLDATVSAQADRLTADESGEPLTAETMRTLTREDVQAAADAEYPEPASR